MSFHDENHFGNVGNGITVDHEKEHLEHMEQDPKLFGPGYSAHESNIRYLLVTPEMVDAMRQGRAPNTHLLSPSVDKVELFNGDLPSPDAMHDKFAIRHVEHHGTHDSDIDTASVDPPSPVPYLVNPLSRFRHQYKEYLGEFIGTMVLIIFGNGVNCQVVLSNLTQGSYLSISFGWGIGVMFGVYACGGVSGAHINPAVTITLALFRGFPWRKVPGYALAQILGACVGSALIQGNYHALLNQFEGGYNLRTYGLDTSTGALFFTAAKPYMSNIGAFCSELFATAVLLALIFAIGDQNNNPVPSGMNGFALLFMIIGIGAALGTETAYCLNPARDLGPRIACAMFGYPKEIWTTRHCNWIYVPIIATICGGILGGFVYDAFIFQGKESPLNKPWGRSKKQIEGGGNIDAAHNA